LAQVIFSQESAWKMDSVLRLGLIADIQYADCDDGSDFSGREKRRFRNSLKVLQDAVACFNDHGVDAIVQLGDIIDGCNAKVGASESAMSTVLNVFGRSTSPVRYDLVGNHDLYNMNRELLSLAGLNFLSDTGKSYRSVHFGDKWELIFLDPYEHALIGLRPDDPNFLEAEQMIHSLNPNVGVEGADWFQGLSEDMYRYVPFNGAVSDEQLTWLYDVLNKAAAEERSALVFTHIPVYGPATKPQTIAWNGDDLLRVLHTFKDTVIAVFAGHDHSGGYAVDPAGVHHVTMASPMLANVGSECFAILECHEGWAQFLSKGRVCVESNTNGVGKEYNELLLAKGADNQPLIQAQT